MVKAGFSGRGGGAIDVEDEDVLGLVLAVTAAGAVPTARLVPAPEFDDAVDGRGCCCCCCFCCVVPATADVDGPPVVLSVLDGGRITPADAVDLTRECVAVVDLTSGLGTAVPAPPAPAKPALKPDSDGGGPLDVFGRAATEPVPVPDPTVALAPVPAATPTAPAPPLDSGRDLAPPAGGTRLVGSPVAALPPVTDRART